MINSKECHIIFIKRYKLPFESATSGKSNKSKSSSTTPKTTDINVQKWVDCFIKNIIFKECLVYHAF